MNIQLSPKDVAVIENVSTIQGESGPTNAVKWLESLLKILDEEMDCSKALGSTWKNANSLKSQKVRGPHNIPSIFKQGKSQIFQSQQVMEEEEYKQK